MSLYIKFEDVRVRLLGKVRFTYDENEENMMSIALAKRLINEAEGDVEQDLSRRYAAPFQTIDGKPFQDLPARPTSEILRTLCELKAVVRILETDFGMGSAVDASKYSESIEKRYKAIIDKQLAERKFNGEERPGQWLYPPLPGVMLAPHNMEADDGFAGQILTTGDHYGDYPAAQINNPSQSFTNGTIDDIDKEGFR